MPPAGEILRREREMQGRCLNEIAASTRIGVRHLKAIEADRYSDLPGPFFARSFVAQYARALGLDPKPLEDAVKVRRPDVDPLPALRAAYQPPRRDLLPRSLTATTAGAAALLAIAIFGSGLFYALVEPEPDRIDQIPNVSREAPADSRPASAPASDLQLVMASTSGAPQPGNSSISVDLSAIEKTWVRVSARGKTLFSGILHPSEQKNVEVPEKGKLLTGNAAGLAVRLNGRPIGPIGRRGQVRTVHFTADSFRIVEPGM